MAPRVRRLDEDEILFGAANVCRLGRDLLYLVSRSGNRKWGQLLQSVVGPEFRVYDTEAYRSSHLDSTVVPLSEGLLLLNGIRISPANCPEVFDGGARSTSRTPSPCPSLRSSFMRVSACRGRIG